MRVPSDLELSTFHRGLGKTTLESLVANAWGQLTEGMNALTSRNYCYEDTICRYRPSDDKKRAGDSAPSAARGHFCGSASTGRWGASDALRAARYRRVSVDLRQEVFAMRNGTSEVLSRLDARGGPCSPGWNARVCGMGFGIPTPPACSDGLRSEPDLRSARNKLEKVLAHLSFHVLTGQRG